MAKRWTDADISYLIENYGKMEISDIAKHLGKSIDAVINKATKLRANGVDIKTSYKGKPKGTKNKKPTKQQLLEEKKKEEQRLKYEKEKMEVERIYQKIISKPLDYGIGDKIDNLKFKLGQTYVIMIPKQFRSPAKAFKGKLIQETNDFIVLENSKWRESFLKKDLLTGIYEIKEVV